MSFDSGFSQGRGIVNDAFDRQRQQAEFELRKEAAARDATVFADRQADRRRDANAYQEYEANISGYAGNEALIAEQNATGGPVQGMSVQKPLSRMDQIGARRDLAIGLRSSPDQLAALDKEYGAAQEDDLFSKAEFTAEDTKWLNNNHKSLTVKDAVDAKGKKTGYRLTDIVDGTAVDHMISMADGKKLAGALAIMKLNPTRALDIIGGIDKNLAEIVARENGLKTNVGDTGNKVQGNINDDAHKAAVLADTVEFHKGSLRNDAARTGIMRGAYADKNKTADPKLVAENNRLYAEMQAETDPTKFKKLQNLFRANEVLLANSLGKIMTLGGGGADKADAGMKVNGDGTVTMGGKLYVQDPKTPGAYKEATGFGQSALDKAIAGGAPAVTPQKSQPGMAPPADKGRELYDAWQASKPSYFDQGSPTSLAREQAAEQAYLEYLRNPK
jgi:hypothetical protein